MPVCERFREPAANTVPITSGHRPNSGAEAGEVNRAAGRNSAYLNVPLLMVGRWLGPLINTGAPVTADIGARHSGAMSVEVVGDQLDGLRR